MFEWIKNLTKKKPKLSYDIKVNILENINKPEIIKQEPVRLVKPEPKRDIFYKEQIDMNLNDLKFIWLVVVDTTGLNKATRDYNEEQGSSGGVNDARKLGHLGIKTFAFVNAPDINAAKGIFWKTLTIKNKAARPFLKEIARATRVTNFTQIFPVLTRVGAVWNYVGGRDEAMPGQQSPLAKQAELTGKDPYGNDSSSLYHPAQPYMPEMENAEIQKGELGNLSAEDRKVLNSQPKPAAAIPGMPAGITPEMMQAMAAFMAMMQNGGKMPAAPAPVQPATTRATRQYDELTEEELATIDGAKLPMDNDADDPELAQSINEMRERGSKGIDLNFDDEKLDPNEMAKMAKQVQAINPQPENKVLDKKKRRVAEDG